MTLGNEQWKPGHSLAVVPKEGKAGEPVTKIQATPWLMVSAEDPAQAPNQSHHSLSHCLKEDKQGDTLSLADDLKERSSLGPVM